MEGAKRGNKGQFEGFGSEVFKEAKNHKRHILGAVGEATDTIIHAYEQMPAHKAFEKCEERMKRAGFHPNELVNVYSVDFLPKQNKYKLLENKIKRLTRNGELGYYVWAGSKILRTQIILKRCLT